jgi:hypothetical protein
VTAPLSPGWLLASSNRAVEQAMAEVPEGQGIRAALVFGATTEGEVSTGLAVRVGDDWRIEGQLAVDVDNGKIADKVGSVRAVWRIG